MSGCPVPRLLSSPLGSVLSYCLEVCTPRNTWLTNSSGNSPTRGYLNRPENDIHVPVDTLKRVHGAATPSGDGKQGLLILKEKTSVTRSLLGPSELMNRGPQGRRTNEATLSGLLFQASGPLPPQHDSAHVPTVAGTSMWLWIAMTTAQINSLKTLGDSWIWWLTTLTPVLRRQREVGLS